MARLRKSDEQSALGDARNIVRAEHFEAPPTRNLTARTGATTSSTYAAFGDKRGLLLRALDHCLARLCEKMSRLEANSSPTQAIPGFFEPLANASTTTRAVRRGT
jgi:TetR/AcrR family transcriptional repressor of nem operon